MNSKKSVLNFIMPSSSPFLRFVFTESVWIPIERSTVFFSTCMAERTLAEHATSIVLL
jgi:hypothetical protein